MTYLSLFTRSRQLTAGFCVVAWAVLTAASATATPVKALFLGFDSNVSFVKNDILGTDARFDLSNSAALENPGSVSLATLLQYDSVLVWSNYSPSAGLGDALADYVDAGGGVVLSTFNGYYGGYGSFPGRINSAGYNPLTGGTTNAYNSVTLGTYDSSSPLMSGVSSLSSSRYNGDYLGLDAGAMLVASWNNGRPLAALNADGNVASITLFPNVVTHNHASGDYQQLFRNALFATANPSASNVPDSASSLMLVALGLTGLLFTRFRRDAR